MWGQWVWDCGHWGEGIQTNSSDPQGSLIGTGDYFLPGQIEGPAPNGLRGEQSELHPIQALAVTRAAAWRASGRQRETDFFVSNDGTHAYAESRCAKLLNPVPGLASYGPDFSACVNNAANQVAGLRGRTFTFLAPAPRRPFPHARLTYRIVSMVKGHGFKAQLRPTSKGLIVRVKDVQAASDHGLAAFGASYYVGWRGGGGKLPVHLRWTLQTLTVHHSLAEPNPNHPTVAGAPGVGVYNLYLNLNGYWNFLGGKGASDLQDDSWIPGLGTVRDGQTFAVNRSVDLFVPAGPPVRIDISGRECDLPRIAPCSANPEVADGNDHPGEAIAMFASARAAVGRHTLRSPIPSATDPNYELTYTIKMIRGIGAGASAPGNTGVSSSTTGGDLGGAGTVLAGRGRGS
jgi:hypothetical protein